MSQTHKKKHHHHRPHHKKDKYHGCLSGLGWEEHHDLHPPEQTPHWEYEGEHGTEHWSDICEQWVISKTGHHQSPIDVKEHVNVDEFLTDIHLDYHPTEATILNNGHTIQVNWSAGKIVVDGVPFQLAQFHFHAPSEHTLQGVSYPLEMHLVHKHDEDHRLAVVGILFQEGEQPNEFLNQFVDILPDQHTENEPPHQIPHNLDPGLLNVKGEYYKYLGSLTTPPCSEGVTWFVVQTPQTISSAQLAKFHEKIKRNNRPVQQLYDRNIHLYQHQ